jgi:hypothetical protein
MIKELTFGWYLRKFIADTRARGATPIVCSLVPRKIWRDGKIVRNSEDYAGWAADVAKSEKSLFVDLNEIIARKYDELGPEKVEPLFADERTHTSLAGAELNAACVIAGLKALKENPMAIYFSAKAKEAPSKGVIDAGDIQIKVRYRLIKLWEISARRALTMNRESLLPFIPLMRGGLEELEISAQRLAQVPDVSRRSEMGLHFLMLGGLRYNRIDLLELIGRKSMITLEQLKESSFYQFILEEGELKSTREMLRMLAAKRFSGLKLGEEVDQIHNLNALQRLCLEVSDLPDAETLKQQIDDLVQADMAIAK